MTSQSENHTRLARPDAGQDGTPRSQQLLAAGGVLGAIAASSCCLLPLVLFGLGVSGAWIGSLTRIAPYQPYFLAATAACLAGGYWLRYRSGQRACAAGEVCTRQLPSQAATIGLILASILVVAAVALDFLAPLFY